jgi:Domain of unknown function (DUF4134)
MKMCALSSFKRLLKQKNETKLLIIGVCIEFILLLLSANDGFCQDGSSGITAATTNLVTYFAVGVTLMYAIGAVLGLVGAIKVYQKWSHGDHDTSKVAASWFGSCIFLVIVATVLKSFFGV